MGDSSPMLSAGEPVHDTESQIEQWQDDLHPFLAPEKTHSIARLFAASSELWRDILQVLSKQGSFAASSMNKLQSAHSYFILWADGYGVPSGKFENEMRRSQRAGNLTIQLLQSICTTLSGRLISIAGLHNLDRMSLKAAEVSLAAERLVILLQGDDDNDGSSDDTNESTDLSHTSESLDQISEDLITDTQCLMDLGDRFEDQVKNPIASEAAANPADYNSWTPSDHFIERVLLQYPKCETTLAGRLGEAVWLRLSQVIPKTSDGLNEAESLNETGMPSSSSPIRDKRLANSVDASLFQDSGLGTSVAISHMASTAGETSEADFNASSIFKLPEAARSGKTFNCTTCGETMDLITEDQWKEHLIADVEPYVCPEFRCFAPLFGTVSEWEDHMDRQHPSNPVWGEPRCRICGEDTEDRRQPRSTKIDRGEDDRYNYGKPYGKAQNEQAQNQDRMHKLQRPSCSQCVKAKKTCTGYPPPVRRTVGLAQQEQLIPTFVAAKPARFMGGQNQLETFPAFDPLGIQPPASPHIDGHKAKEPDSNQPNSPEGSNPSAPVPPTTSRFQASTRGPNFYYTASRDPNDSGRIDPTKPLSAATPLPPPVPPFGPAPAPPLGERPLDDETSNVVELKRARNTLAARKSRERKARQIEELEEKITRLEREREHWKEVAMSKSEQEPYKGSGASQAGGT
ncbi:Cross-pathway control 1 [Apiospora aurea]|uniref:Cross-pathway control 1 n=1 Tax=Apiospora aurea TaxID=335848 RepID=A0ABR1QSK3_9PEZI